jgi:hypothetical protein
MARENSLKLTLLVGIVLYFMFSAFFTYSWSPGPNYRNVTIDTTVNITNAPPAVLSVIIEASATNITLTAGTFKNITCNATVRDYNGGSTITNISATFYNNATNTSFSADDNNTHYTNTNCTLGNFDTYTRNVSCSFSVQYHADVRWWACNVTATDPYVFTNTSRQQSLQNITFINQLLALNVTPLIDYGNLAVGDIAAPQQANVTNLGNWNINISVRGYGLNVTDGLAFYCDIGNIALMWEKYNVIGGSDITVYTNLTNISRQIPTLTVMQQQNDSQPVINATYWTLVVPNTAFGRCNGTIVFQAEVS